MTETKGENIKIVFSMKGGMAESGEVPAFASLESLHAFSQALMICLYYAKTGEVRRRRFKELDVDLRLLETKPGSLEVWFNFAEFAPYFLEAYGKGAAQASWSLVRSVFSRAIGLRGDEKIEDLESDGKIPAGDTGALVQAIEPSLRKSHAIINNGANNINIFIQGDSNSVVLDGASKEYMHEDIFNDEMRSQRFIVTSYDGRNRTGRVFDLEDEQAYTFDLLTDADRRSLIAIVDAARAYALREKGKFDESTEIICVFTSVDAPDGRKKRLKVFAAAKEFDDLDLAKIDRMAIRAQRISPSPARRLLGNTSDVQDDDPDLIE